MTERYFGYLEGPAQGTDQRNIGRVIMLDVTDRQLAALGINMFVAENASLTVMTTEYTDMARGHRIMATTPADVETLAFLNAGTSRPSEPSCRRSARLIRNVDAWAF